MIRLWRMANGAWRRWSRRQLVAVDFDSRQLRIVSARRQAGRLRIEKLNSTPMPEGMDVADPKAVGEFLGKVLKQMGLGSADVVMSVPRGQAVLKGLSLPPGTPPAEYAGMVQFQMSKELPFRPEDAVIDFTTESHYDIEPGGQDEQAGCGVLVGAVRLQVVDYFRQLARSAGVRLRRLGLRPYADRRCVEACMLLGRGERVGIVHITSDETEIDVLVDGSLAFSRSAVLQVPPLGPDNEAQRAAAAEAVVREVSLSLQSYHAGESGGKISRMLLAGGTGIEPLVARKLSAEIDVGCEILDPSAALGLPEDAAETSAFIAALGLVLDQAAGGDVPFDLLSPKRPPVQRDIRKIRIVAGAAAAAVIVLAAVVIGAVHVHKNKARVTELRSERKELEKQVRKVRILRKRIEAIDAWVSDGRLPLLDHWARLSGLFPGCEKVYITSLRSSSGAMDFTVRAHDTEVVGELGNRLDGAGYSSKPGQMTIRTDPFGYQAGTSLKVFLDAQMEVDVAGIEYPRRPSDDISATTTRPPGSVVWPSRSLSRPGGSSRSGGSSSRSGGGSSRLGRDSRGGLDGRRPKKRKPLSGGAR